MSQLNLTFFRKLKGVVTVEPFTKEVFVIVWGLVKTGVYDPYISGIFEISLEHVSFLKYPLNGYSWKFLHTNEIRDPGNHKWKYKLKSDNGKPV